LLHFEEAFFFLSQVDTGIPKWWY